MIISWLLQSVIIRPAAGTFLRQTRWNDPLLFSSLGFSRNVRYEYLNTWFYDSFYCQPDVFLHYISFSYESLRSVRCKLQMCWCWMSVMSWSLRCSWFTPTAGVRPADLLSWCDSLKAQQTQVAFFQLSFSKSTKTTDTFTQCIKTKLATIKAFAVFGKLLIKGKTKTKET